MLDSSCKISDCNIANSQKRAGADSLQSETVLKAKIKQLESTIEKREIENEILQTENLALNEKIRTNENFISEILFNKNMESNIIIPALVQKYDEFLDKTLKLQEKNEKLNESLNNQIAKNEKLQADNIEKIRGLNFSLQRIIQLDEEEKLVSSMRSLRNSLSDKATQERKREKSHSHFQFRQNPESLKIDFSSEEHFPSRRFVKGRRKNKPE